MSWVVRGLRSPWWWGIGCFVVGSFVSLWVSEQIAAFNHSKVQALVTKETDRIVEAASQRVLHYDNGLYAVRTHVLSAKFNLSRPEFKSFIESLNLELKFPGTRGFGVIFRVPLEQEPAYVAKARLDGKPDFAIRQFKANALDRYVTQYIEPETKNSAAVGLDVGSEVLRRNAADEAVDTGEIRITAPITLVQAANEQKQSFLILLPIYATWATPNTIEERRAQTKAWASAPLLMPEILAGIALDKENFSVQFQDVDTQERHVFYMSDTENKQQFYTQKRVLPVYGRHWLITLSASQHYVNNLGLITRINSLMMGLFISVIISVLVGMIVFNRRQSIEFTRSLEKRIQERTQELNNTKRNLEILLNAVPISISQWTRYQTHIISNRACQYRFDVSAEEIQKLSLQHFWNTKNVPQFDSLLEGVMSGYPQTTEYKINNENGEHSYLLHFVPDLEGAAVVGFFVIELDITDLVQSQTRLLEAKRETQSLLDAINQQFPYSVTDRSGKIIEVNDQFCAITGYSREELMGKTHKLLNGGHHSREFWVEVWGCIASGKTWRGEICNRTQGGEIIWLDTVISPVFDSHGRLTRYIALRSDITARKKAEAAREELSRYLQDVMSATSQVAIIATDLEGTITLFNRGAENLLSYSAEELVGKSSPAIFHKLTEVILRGEELSAEAGRTIEGFQVFAHKLSNGETETRRWTYVRKDGTEFMVSLSTAMIVDQHQYPVGYVGIATDISHQHELEKNLRLAKEMADQASQAKSQFLANMSHEIRTPMNAVLGMLQLMRHTPLNVQQEDYVQKAHSAAKSLLEILNDILDFSKIDAGKLQLDPVEFDLEELLRDLSIVLSGNHKNKTVEVLFELDVNLPSQLLGDRLRLQQVLVNLASNALKFTAEGFVKIHIQLTNTRDKNALIRFSVEDSGIGISPEQQLKLFQSFTQAEASTTRRFGGTGLGLVISKRLVELMGAELCIDSTLNQGSRFYFEIELPIANQLPLNSHPLIQTKPLKILVVDDNEGQRKTISAGLACFGWTIDTAADGPSALTHILQREATEAAYDLILLDWYMPSMGALSIAQALHEKMNTAVPIILMPNGFERQKISALSPSDQALFSDSVVKPATPKQLAESIWQTLFGRFPKKEIAQEKPLQNLKILVVEDNELNRQVAFELLESAGATIDLAEGGLEGVSKVTEQSHHYDLVIMDLQMPDIDGLEATRRIRQDARFNYLPILAMTANVTPQDRQACLAAGMNDHMGKPIDLQKVIPLILSLTGRLSAIEASPILVAEKPIALLENLDQVLNRFGGNKDLYEKILAKFVPEIRALLDKYYRAQTENDVSSAVIAMHSIKGVSATMGATALSKSASHLEKLSKVGQWASPAELKEIEILFEQTQAALAQVQQQEKP